MTKEIKSKKQLVDIVTEACEWGRNVVIVCDGDAYTVDGITFLRTTTETTDNETEVIERLIDAEFGVTPGWELEINHFTADDPALSGWYAWEYNEKYGEARPLGGGDNDAIILLDYEERAMNVDMYKICNDYGCFVS